MLIADPYVGWIHKTGNRLLVVVAVPQFKKQEKYIAFIPDHREGIAIFVDVSVFKTLLGAVVNVPDNQDEFIVAEGTARIKQNIRQIYIKFEEIDQHDIYRQGRDKLALRLLSVGIRYESIQFG